MTSAFPTANIPKIEKSYQICAMPKESTIFSASLQFGKLKTDISKDLFLRKKKTLWSKFSHSSLKVDL